MTNSRALPFKVSQMGQKGRRDIVSLQLTMVKAILISIMQPNAFLLAIPSACIPAHTGLKAYCSNQGKVMFYMLKTCQHSQPRHLFPLLTHNSILLQEIR